MNLRITGFSQNVDLEDPSQVRYYLVVTRDDGKTEQLPVPQETTEALVKMVYDPGAQPKARFKGEDGRQLTEDELNKIVDEVDSEIKQGMQQLGYPEGATQFGTVAEDEQPLAEEEPEDDVPASEDKVPSL
jgi:hypothetical protein